MEMAVTCDLWWEEAHSEDGTGGINQTVWKTDLQGDGMTDCSGLYQHLTLYKKLELKWKTYSFWILPRSEWLGGRLTPAEFWTFCLFWLSVRSSPLRVLTYFIFEGSDQILSIPLPCSLFCLFFHCDVKPVDELLHGSSRNTSRNQMQKIETPAFLCTDYAEIFTPTYLNQLCSGEVWLLEWARKLLFQAAQHENFRLGLPIFPLWAVFLSCSKGFLCLICCPCAVWP